MKLRLEPHPGYVGVDNLMAGDAVLGQIDRGGCVLRGHGKDWPWRGIPDFLASAKTRPADALAMAEGEMAEARTCIGLALIAARMGEAATVRDRLASVDAAVAAAKAWRELAGYEVTP